MIIPKLKLGVGTSPLAGFTTFSVSLTVCNTILSTWVEPLDFAICELSIIPSLVSFKLTLT